ncbi:MAG TPA: glycosyl hydrolase-related protein [Gemmatimonadaceae bacterium]|nr:glycosyl hydrolase-related protein [Gemmatimonadaceae bacterium]
MDSPPPLDVHVVMHTHWDREWYQPFARFQQRLVALIDELIDDPPGSNESFLLDGQAIVVRDYLDVRPDRADALAALLRDGRLEAGPWYVLADELIPSGEAMVRNLFAGRRELERLGARAPEVLYCPDSFGHPAALPSIAAGFGFPVIIAWRGYGGSRWPNGDTVRWVAPGGESAILFHLPRDGYELGSNLPVDRSTAVARWAAMRSELAPRATTGVTLLPNGADHHARQLDWREALASLEAAGRPDHVHRSSLSRFADALMRHAEQATLPTVRGELRDSYGYTWTLGGTLATRAHEKRLNARAERLLLRETEPWSALAAARGTSRRPLVEAAWRTVLSAHPHDTFCGCSIDDVAVAMEARLRAAIVQAQGIRDDSIAALIGHDAAQVRTARESWTPIVVIRNAVPRARSGVAIVDVEQFVADVRVGPGSAPTAADERTDAPRGRPRIAGVGPVQVLSRELRHSRTESPRHYPDDDLVAVERVAAWVSDVPAYGLVSHKLGGPSRNASAPSQPVTVERWTLGNAHLSVTVADDGSIALEERRSGRRVANLVALIDEDDAGDLYTPSPRPSDCVTDFRGARRVHRGPLRGELEARYRIRRRDAKRPRADVTLSLALDADAPFVRLRVAGVNEADDHRVRIAIATDVRPPATVWADAAFGVLRREPIVVPPTDSLAEQPPPTAPLHRYVSLFGANAGATVFSDGLAEYEARDDGAILVTLVRAVGELSRNDLPERPGHAGWPAPTPLAQCRGPFEAELAVMLHGPRRPAVIDAIERTADDVLLPLRGETLRSALGVPEPVSGVELHGLGLAFAAVKESEDGTALILRCTNLLEEPARGVWRLPFDTPTAALARLDETSMQEVEVQGRAIAVAAGPRAVATLRVPLPRGGR